MLDILSSVPEIKGSNGNCISFEGNGRVDAFKKVFDRQDGIRLAVKLYTIGDKSKILRRVKRVQNRNF